MNITGQRVRIAQALIGLLGLAFLAQIGRLVYIQVTMRPELLAWSRRYQRSEIPLPGRRGQILDRAYRVLAGSHDLPMIYADPLLIPDHIEAARLLSGVLDLTAEDILEKLTKPSSPRYVILRRQAEAEEVAALEQLRQEHDLPGVGLQMASARAYPGGSLAAHVIGFVGVDGQGLDGVEMTCNEYLEATPGKRVVWRDVGRRPIFQEPDSYIPPKDGVHVVLTLDAAIQASVEKHLQNAVTSFEAECGVGIVMNPQNGEVLALANYPTYAPAEARTAPMDHRRNRVLTDPVEPGSIFKPFIMVAALDQELTQPEEIIFCHNGLYVTGKRLLHDHHPYGDLSVTQIMTKSSNIGMAILGQRLGNEAMYESLRRMGYGWKTGIDLPGEGVGLLMPLSAWNSYSTTSVPMGHEMAVTPIQIITAFSSLINGGRLYRPRVVAGVVDSAGRVLKDMSAPELRRQVVSPQAADAMRQILVKVVNEGTGRRCQLDRWQVLGKTGTAQVPYENRRGYEPDAYLSSFIAAAPASEPTLAVLVMVRKPNRKLGYYGSQVSAPAVREILAESLAYLGVPHDQPDESVEDPDRQLAWDLND